MLDLSAWQSEDDGDQTTIDRSSWATIADAPSEPAVAARRGEVIAAPIRASGGDGLAATNGRHAEESEAGNQQADRDAGRCSDAVGTGRGKSPG